MKAILSALSVLFMTSGSAVAADWPPPGMACPQRTVVFLQAGPNVSQAKTVSPQHLAFITSHMRQGDILAGGPFSGSGGALLVLPGVDWNAAQQLVGAEPFTQAGVLKVVGHEVWSACQLAK